MWSEHCSYKSSRPTLKKYLPTQSPFVILGPVEDAGVVEIGTHAGVKYAAVLGHESHNHPSQIVPYEGAATGNRRHRARRVLHGRGRVRRAGLAALRRSRRTERRALPRDSLRRRRRNLRIRKSARRPQSRRRDGVPSRLRRQLPGERDRRGRDARRSPGALARSRSGEARAVRSRAGRQGHGCVGIRRCGDGVQDSRFRRRSALRGASARSVPEARAAQCVARGAGARLRARRRRRIQGSGRGRHRLPRVGDCGCRRRRRGAGPRRRPCPRRGIAAGSDRLQRDAGALRMGGAAHVRSRRAAHLQRRLRAGPRVARGARVGDRHVPAERAGDARAPSRRHRGGSEDRGHHRRRDREARSRAAEDGAARDARGGAGGECRRRRSAHVRAARARVGERRVQARAGLALRSGSPRRHVFPSRGIGRGDRLPRAWRDAGSGARGGWKSLDRGARRVLGRRGCGAGIGAQRRRGRSAAARAHRLLELRQSREAGSVPRSRGCRTRNVGCGARPRHDRAGRRHRFRCRSSPET